MPVLRSHGRLALTTLSALIACLALAASTSARALPGLGPAPATYQMRFGTFSLSPHVVQAGGVLTATTSIHDCDPFKCYPVWGEWFRADMFYPKISDCKEDIDYTCSVRVPKITPTFHTWATVTLPWTTHQGGADATDYYAVIGRDQRMIAGEVSDGAGHPLGGIHVQIAPAGYAVTDATGEYEAFIDRPGRYRVSVAPTKGGRFRPTTCKPGAVKNGACTVKLKQGIARANFELALPARIKVVDPIDDEPYPLDGLGQPGTIHYPASPYADASGNIGSLHNVAVGDRIGIDGDRFDPHGGPITISYDGTAVEKLPAKPSFITSVKVLAPKGGHCAAFLTASQDGQKPRAPVVLAVFAQAWAVSGTVKPRDFQAPLKTGQLMCLQNNLLAALKHAVPAGGGVLVDRLGDLFPVGGVPITAQGFTVQSGRWKQTGAWDGGGWLYAAHPAHSQRTALSLQVNAPSASVHLPGRTLNLAGPVRSLRSDLWSYDEWVAHGGSGQCKQLPLGTPAQRLYLSAASEDCYRDAFAGGIRYPHGVSAAGTPRSTEGANPLYVFGDHGISLGSVSFTGLVSFEAPAGPISVAALQGPRAADERSELVLSAGGQVTIG